MLLKLIQFSLGLGGGGGSAFFSIWSIEKWYGSAYLEKHLPDLQVASFAAFVVITEGSLFTITNRDKLGGMMKHGGKVNN